ncbi:MAG TPA: cupin domain-containing protein [Pirellulaceae bacterium]|nr:cupin domain-containing protein [Pirellulaceae bacterium]
MLRRMNTRTWKVTLAGACVACALGLIAWRVAWATPGSGTTSTGLSGPVVLDEIDTTAETDDWEVEFKTRGLSDVYVTHIKVVPGGFSGWHLHPGPSIISVKAGTATFYQADDPETPNVYPAGSGFVEDAGRAHILQNEGDIDLEIVVVQIVPLGAPRRIEAPAP